MMARTTPACLVLLPLILASSCKERTVPAPGRPVAELPRPVLPASTGTTAASATRESAFQEARAWQHLVNLCNMGPRGHALPGHARAQDYIRQHLRACGAEPRDLAVQFKASRDPGAETFTNIAARFGPPEGPWLLLGSHYDTRLWADEDPDPSRRNKPIAGANDGGSGVAVLLEMASVLHARAPEHGIVLVFFDGEDYGAKDSEDYFAGSRALAPRFDEFFPGGRPSAAVVIDMVGDSDLRFLREGNCEALHPWLNDLLWRAGAEVQPDAFAPRGSMPVTDDHTALLQIGIPATLLIDFTYPQWHQLGDTLDKCSAASLGTTGRMLMRALADGPLPAPAATR